MQSENFCSSCMCTENRPVVQPIA